jgi:hypothetical protein
LTIGAGHADIDVHEIGQRTAALPRKRHSTYTQVPRRGHRP